MLRVLSFQNILQDNAFSLMFLAFIGHSLHVLEEHEASILDGGVAYILADNGQYLTACTGCGRSAYPVSASVQPPSDNAKWTIEVVGDQVAFKGSNGNYLSRCLGCWIGSTITPNNAAFLHQTTSSAPYSRWTPEKLANGKFAFKGDNGQYLSRCEACVKKATSPSQVFLNQASSQSPLAQWSIKYILPAGKFKLQAANGDYLTLCTTGCGPVVTKGVGVAVLKPLDGDNSVWTLAVIGGQLSILGNNGKFLARCNNCMRGGSTPNFAFVHALTSNDAFARWTPSKIGKKWAFKSDVGTYLSPCNGCVAGGKFAYYITLHLTDPSDGWAQWTLIPA